MAHEMFDIDFYADNGENNHWHCIEIDEMYPYKDMLADVKSHLSEMGGGEAEVIDSDGNVHIVYAW